MNEQTPSKKTVYELIKSIPDGQRESLIQAGVIPAQWRRYVSIYEFWASEVKRGVPRMDAYCSASEKYYTSEGNVRKICTRMQTEVKNR